MPNSLKCRLKKLAKEGLLSEKDLSRIYTDNDLVEELKIIRVKITACTSQGEGNFCDIHNNAIEMARKVVDNRISELKGK